MKTNSIDGSQYPYMPYVPRKPVQKIAWEPLFTAFWTINDFHSWRIFGEDHDDTR